MLSLSLRGNLIKSPSIVTRLFSLSSVTEIKSPGPREFTPSNVKRRGGAGRFSWSLRPRWVCPTLREVNRRKERIATDNLIRHGQEKFSRRSEFLEWNYNSELYAFQARIGESFDDTQLRQAFITPDFARAEQERRQSLGENLLPVEAEYFRSSSNETLVRTGREIVKSTLISYIQLVLPNLPSDGLDSLVNHLMKEEMLAHISFHIGTKDLVQSEEYPPTVHNMAEVFLALVAALNESSGARRAIRFVLDLIAPQLHGLDLSEVWNLENPMGYLVKLLDARGMGEPESRLLWVSGRETILACYHVGIYSDKKLIGQAPGETTEIAEDMAARDALRRILQFEDSSQPSPLGKDANKIVDLILDEKKNVQSLS